MKKRTRARTEYSPARLCASTLRGCVSTLLLYHCVCGLLSSEFTGWDIPLQTGVWIQTVLLVVAVLYELTPVCGKYRAAACALIEMVCFAGAGFFLYKNYEELCAGQEEFFADFIPYWNKYYGTNYMAYNSNGDLTFMLAFAVFAVFLVCMILRYITSRRLFLLVPGVFALALGLLVNTLPEWTPLCLFFTGVLVLYSGSERTSRIVYRIKDKEKSKIKHKATDYAVLPVVVALGAGILILSRMVFSGVAERIPEKKTEFQKIQKTLEDNIKSLENTGFGMTQNWARVDNRTPEYDGKTMLSVYAAEKPEKTLYLKDFHSGTYRGGKWQSEDRAFGKAAENAGFQADHVGLLLNQITFENMKSAELEDEAWNEVRNRYRIEYAIPLISQAYVPYDTDLSESGEDFWVKNEGLIYKKRGLKSLEVTGLTEHYDWYGAEIFPGNAEGGSRELDWYAEYVQEHYRNGAEGVAALKDYAETVRAQYQEGTKDVHYISTSGASQAEIWVENEKRMDYAELVRKELAKNAVYNLYLDEIPEKTDTIQYFLQTGHEGYCMHFASAGALILQELGVPARYASGYVVDSRTFTKYQGEYRTKVEDRNAHAWVEVYLENSGWVPFEMTPGYQLEAGEGLPTASDHQEELQKRHQEKTSKQENTQNSGQENSEGEQETEAGTEPESEETESGSEPDETGTDNKRENNSSEKENRTNPYVVYGLLLIVVLFGISAGCIYRMQRNQNILVQNLNQKKNRNAVRYMNRRIYKRMWKTHTLTDEEFLERLIQDYPAVSETDWRKYMQIVQRAVFSREEITQEEAEFCYQCYQKRKQ